MTDIDTILKAAAPRAVRPDPAVVAADLARGRAALITVRRRRTRRRVVLSAAPVAAAAVAAVIVISPGSTPSVTSAQSTTRLTMVSTARTATRPGRPRVELVDYTGAQLPGFTVGQVPQGWHLSTSTSTALLITPDGVSNHDPDDFAGKLAVLTSSSDQQGLGPGDPVTVDGRPGRVQTSSGILMLTYDSPNGFGVVIQAPEALHWSVTQIVDFAEGVQVTADAVHAKG